MFLKAWAFLFYLILVLMATVLLTVVQANKLGTPAHLAAIGFGGDGSGTLILARMLFAASCLMTMGYGPFSPSDPPSVIVATILQVAGIVSNVFLFSIIITKYQQPNAELVFSDNAIFTRRNGQPYFLFRIANKRCNFLFHPTFFVTLVRKFETAEGESFMKPTPLALETEPALISGCVTIAHHITPESPLYDYCGYGMDDMDDDDDGVLKRKLQLPTHSPAKLASVVVASRAPKKKPQQYQTKIMPEGAETEIEEEEVEVGVDTKLPRLREVVQKVLSRRISS